MRQVPPKWADRFLRWYCNPIFLEEIEGDIHELFELRVDEKGLQRARIRFIWDVFRFFRWSNIRRSNSKFTSMNQLSLFKNYLKLGMRNIRKNLVSASINIFGLAIAICFAISIFIFTDIMRSMDAFHTKKDRIYQITNYVEQEGDDAIWSDSPITLGPKILADHPSIEAFTRVEYQSASVKYNANVFDELSLFVDPAYFEMFDFPFLNGNQQVLYTKSQLAISKDMAVKYFSGEDPMGKELEFKFTDGQIKRFTVGAVLDKFPYNSGMVYDFFIPMDNFFDLEPSKKNDWAYMTDATFIMLKKGEDLSLLTESFEDYQTLQNASDPEWKVMGFLPFKLSEVSLNSFKIISSVIQGAHPAGRIALTIIAVFLLVMACFNYMNISVVSATKRLKEIALRKVMGSVRGEIIKQFLVENILQCFFALILGTLLAYFFLVPYFDVIIPELDVKFRTYEAMSLVMFLVILLLSIGILSGAYPAFYISKFNAITIFKGKEKFGNKNILSKIMLGFQFFLSVMTIVGCIVFVDQSIHLGSKDWGYDPSSTISVYVSNQEQYELLKNELTQHPAVKGYTASNYLIGRSVGVSSLEIEDRKLTIRRIGVMDGFSETFGLRIVDGRPFEDLATDRENSVIINEQFIESMGWDKAEVVGRSFMMDSIRKTVIGVVADFHYYSFYQPIDPVVIHGIEERNVHYLTLKTTKEQIAGLDEYALDKWRIIGPNDPYDRVFQEDVFDDFYVENQGNITLILIITGIAIVLACLGLYGLLSYSVQGNLKEFSIRKVLGAEPRAIIKVINKQYIWVLIISFIIGAPLGALGMMKLVVSVFPEAKEVTAVPFLISILMMLSTLILTVAGQLSKAIRVNPAELLRSE